MRVIVCGLVLAITALAAEFGKASAGLQIAGAATGALLVLSVIVDRVLPEKPAPPAGVTKIEMADAVPAPPRDGEVEH